MRLLRPFFLDLPQITIENARLDRNAVTIEAMTTAANADCPSCGRPSDRVHSRYVRTVQDLPWQGRSVTITLTVRRFRCLHPGCAQAIFCERLPDFLAARARTTERQTGAHRILGFALGGEAGARVSKQLAMTTSPDTLLRRVKQSEPEAGKEPRVIGLDDWALRKGHRYGTIIIDLERGRVLDLLPGRDGEALKAWLQAHPGVEVVSRDRWAAYAQAVTAAAPQARQIADRWHLLKNLREALERLFDRRFPQIKEALAAAPAVATGEEAITACQEAPSPAPTPATLSSRQQERIARYERVRQMHRDQTPIRKIARDLGLSRGAIRSYLRGDSCPDWKPGPRRTQLDDLGAYVDQRLEAGCTNATELHKELRGRGCRASISTVRRFVNRRLAAVGRRRERANATLVHTPRPPTARELSFDFLCRADKREPGAQARLEAVRAADAELAEALELAGAFVAMVRKESATPFTTWLAQAEASLCLEIRRYAEGLRKEQAPVNAALTEPWSNGPVEGHVNRLKTIKRQMYGRASFQLLRARVLHVA
jgi:transposase